MLYLWTTPSPYIILSSAALLHVSSFSAEGFTPYTKVVKMLYVLQLCCIVQLCLQLSLWKKGIHAHGEKLWLNLHSVTCKWYCNLFFWKLMVISWWFFFVCRFSRHVIWATHPSLAVHTDDFKGCYNNMVMWSTLSELKYTKEINLALLYCFACTENGTVSSTFATTWQHDRWYLLRYHNLVIVIMTITH